MRKVFRQVITGLVWSRRDGGDMMDKRSYTLIPKKKRRKRGTGFTSPCSRVGKKKKEKRKKLWVKFQKGGGSCVAVSPQWRKNKKRRKNQTGLDHLW